MEHKVLKIDKCSSKLNLVKCIRECTKKNLHEAKCIIDQLVPSYGSHQEPGVLLLNESSITPEQWENIVKEYEVNYRDETLIWHYV